jgi:hypothetical protein
MQYAGGQGELARYQAFLKDGSFRVNASDQPNGGAAHIGKEQPGWEFVNGNCKDEDA